MAEQAREETNELGLYLHDGADSISDVPRPPSDGSDTEDSMSISTEAILLVARLDEMEILVLRDGQTLADVARIVDEHIQSVL